MKPIFDSMVLAAMVVAVSTGCAAPIDEKARLAALEAEGKAMDQAVDSLEARLLSGQEAVEHWEELARRHKDVSALACKVTDRHLEGMVRNLEHQEDKERRKARGEQVVAQAAVPAQAD